MNYHYAIGLCIALLVLMLAVEIALRKLGATVVYDKTIAEELAHTQVEYLEAFSTHINSPYYVALNFA